jgi:hypothetical protein
MYLAFALMIASPAPTLCPSPSPVASASASPSPRPSSSQPSATPAPTQVASPGPCLPAATPTPTALATATSTAAATPKPTPAPAAVRPYRQPLSFKPFSEPAPPSAPRSSVEGPVPQGTYQPQLPYRKQRVSEAIAEPGPTPSSGDSFPAAPAAGGLLLLLIAAHVRSWAGNPN